MNRVGKKLRAHSFFSNEAGHSCFRASRQETDMAFMACGNGFIIEAGWRLELTNMGAALTDDEVSDMVRVIREAGGAVNE